MINKVPQVFGHIEIVQPDSFVKSLLGLTRGDCYFAQISASDFEIKSFETVPVDGFDLPSNFPNCCESHDKLYQSALDLFNDFPNCCVAHRGLLSVSWFDKLNYTYLPLKLVKTIAYTLDCIKRSATSPTWHKEIVDYISYTVRSYGQFPTGFGAPLGVSQYINCIANNLDSITEISSTQNEQIRDHLFSFSDGKKESKASDIEILIDIYKEWLRLFPFEITYLQHLKPYFENLLPILQGPIETNIYTGVSSSRLSSKKTLLKFLKDVTLEILNRINTLQLYRDGQLNNQIETEIQLLVAKRNIEIEELKISKIDRKSYIKLLKSWLEEERMFVSQLRPLLHDEFSTDAFIHNLIDGIKLLQNNDTNEFCIMNVRKNGPNKESSIRYWFKNFLTARYKDAVVTAEEENGPGRMDLKIYHKLLGTKVIEFKGWWNQDKKGTPEQIVNYLTDFENEGYIIMINHLEKKDITVDYKSLVHDPITKMELNSWTENKIKNSDITFFESKHKFAVKTKRILHFIFNVHF